MSQEVQAPTLAAIKQQARTDMLASMPSAAADERVLLELAAGQLPLIGKLEDAQAEAMIRITQLADHPTSAVAFARLLRELTMLSGSIGKRVSELLQAASNLRAQRRFLELHGGASTRKAGANDD